MSLDTVPARIALIADGLSVTIGAVTYTLNAIDPPPPNWDTARLPGLYVLTGEAEDSPEDADADYELRTYHVQVPVMTVGEGVPDLRETRCRPFIQAVKVLFRARPGLGDATHGNLAGVVNASVIGDSGVVQLAEYDGQFIGFEVRLKVLEKMQRTYAAYQ